MESADHTSMRSQIASNATDTPHPAPFDTFDLPPISAASFNGKAAFCQTSIPTRSILLIVILAIADARISSEQRSAITRVLE
jgi:hypothetical protein